MGMTKTLAKSFILAALAVASAAPSFANTPEKPSEPIAPGNRKAFCRGEVAGIYNTRPTYVTTGKLVRGKKGATSVSGTVDLGSQGMKKFMCKYDAKGRLYDVMSMTSDGE
jgi:hypothetical protein